MTDCNHLVGFGRNNIRDISSGDVLATWLSEIRASEAPRLFWDGYTFKFCPECGADVSEIIRNRMSGLSFGKTIHKNWLPPDKSTGGA